MNSRERSMPTTHIFAHTAAAREKRSLFFVFSVLLAKFANPSIAFAVVVANFGERPPRVALSRKPVEGCQCFAGSVVVGVLRDW